MKTAMIRRIAWGILVLIGLGVESAWAQRYPERRFSLLIGSDNVPGFRRWVRHEEILDRYPVWVYPREGYNPPLDDFSRRFHYLENVPLMPQAATDIRELIAHGDDSRNELPPGIWTYIQTHGLYGYARK